MGRKGIEEIWPEDFEAYIDSHDETEYLLVDVRQPQEYSDEHIPGAKLIPLGQIDARIGEMPSGRDIIFYCGSGARSRVAALMVADQLETESSLYSLAGGIMAWESRLLRDMPHIAHFDGMGTIRDLLCKAMELEKGAFLFYSALLERFGDYNFAKDLGPLAKAETAHARMLHGFIVSSDKDFETNFDSVFESLKGDIIEGGLKFGELMRRFESLAERDLCLQVMETALDIEFAAYDLYRVMAEQAADKDAREAFLSLSQAEKGHMKVITKAIDRSCIKAGE